MYNLYDTELSSAGSYLRVAGEINENEIIMKDEIDENEVMKHPRFYKKIYHAIRIIFLGHY